MLTQLHLRREAQFKRWISPRFPTPTPTDSQFIVDTPYPPGHCQFRNDGSLKFTVAITRYVGPVNGGGKLSNPQALVNSGVIAPTVTLTMPAFDVDYSTVTFPPDQPERDRVLLNGEFIGDLVRFVCWDTVSTNCAAGGSTGFAEDCFIQSRNLSHILLTVSALC